MKINRIIYPVTTLGPGKRIGVWTVGCTKHCENCISPELWDSTHSVNTKNREIVRIIRRILERNKVEGITFSGGDPLEQYKDLIRILSLFKRQINDVLVYTGYNYDEYLSSLSSRNKKKLNSLIDVVIDGRYIHKLNDNKCTLKGSTNQRIIYNNGNLREKYDKYILQGRSLQNIFFQDRVITIGIQNREI